jgi:F0F1-type ATP synthase membrane subunit a
VNIRALGVLNVIGVAILALAWMVPARQASSAAPLYVILGLAAALSFLMAWTAFARPGWGRWFGIVMLVLGLLNFPIGTLISIIGLIAYVRGRRLFGEDKILHKDLAEVFKQRKVEKK